jgi:amino acid adenylation domain-containing protein
MNRPEYVTESSGHALKGLELPPRQRALRARCVHPSGAFEPFPLEATEQSVPARFEEIVRRQPARLAVRGESSHLSYEALNRNANRIAYAILDRRGARNEPIALLMEKDLSAVAAGMGLLKAGKILVPFDPSFPEARLAALLQECRAPLVLTTRRYEGLAQIVAGERSAVLNVEALDGALSTSDAGLALGPETLAWILYTSGSTGQPKGVVNNHRGMLHQAMRQTNAFHIGTDDRLALLGSMSAGQALTHLYAALLSGAAVFLRDLKEHGLADLASWLRRERVTSYRSSASVFRHWATHLSGIDTLPSLRMVGLASEPVYQHDFELYRRNFGSDCLFLNTLSSIETGTVCMNVLDHDSEVAGQFVPVGFPLQDVEVLLLDETGAEVARADVGEIAVRSRGLAVGYWQQEELSRTKFRTEPGGGGIRTYFTGDVGRRAPDGALVHLGRGDRRVKIRGHRIELGEIEAALSAHEAIRQAVVVDRNDHRGEKCLVAYIIPTSDEHPTRGALRRFLRDRIPNYMIPFAFSFVDDLPLTPGGKIDRQALPPFVPPVLDRRGAEPASLGLLATQLCAIWEDLLGVTGVGLHDDFVELGGDSLLAIEMITRIEEVCGRTLPPSRLLDGGITIERLVHVLLDDERANWKKPVTAVQAGGSRRPIFFAHGDFENGGLYCHNLAKHLGPDQPLYAVTPHGLDGGPLPWSIETMAAERVEALLAIQPTGPYRLGGLCNGGVLAFEMARQLQSRGESVEALLLVDSRALNAPLRYRLLSRVLGRVARSRHWSDAKRRAVFLRLRRLDEACTWTFLFRLRRFSERYRASAQAEGPGRTRFVLDKIRAVLTRWSWPTAEDEGPLPPPAYVQRLRDCLRDYVPGKFHGRIALFRSSHLLERPPAGLTAGWDRVALAVDVHPLPGNHQLAVTRYVSVLAEKIRPYLT